MSTANCQIPAHVMNWNIMPIPSNGIQTFSFIEHDIYKKALCFVFFPGASTPMLSSELLDELFSDHLVNIDRSFKNKYSNVQQLFIDGNENYFEIHMLDLKLFFENVASISSIYELIFFCFSDVHITDATQFPENDNIKS